MRPEDREWLYGGNAPRATTDAAVSEPVAATPAGRVSRRALLGTLPVAGAGLAALGLGGWALNRRASGEPVIPGVEPQEAQASCVDPSSLSRHERIGRARLVYEPTKKAAPLLFDAGFHDQLERWLEDWNATNPYGPVGEIWGYGAFVPKDGCRSWHANGRALDISRLRSGDRLLVSAREDLWHEVSEARRAELKAGYWRLAASLNLHFAYVLSYHFDERHRNHLHIDNGVSGDGMSRFNPDSRVQNQSVQEICNAIWGRPGPVTGQWEDARRQVEPVLRELDLKDLTRQRTWQEFLRASVQRS